eukprot:3470325-Prymnesium_polylepis.1
MARDRWDGSGWLGMVRGPHVTVFLLLYRLVTGCNGYLRSPHSTWVMGCSADLNLQCLRVE